jgi:hypothetical protein
MAPILVAGIFVFLILAITGTRKSGAGNILWSLIGAGGPVSGLYAIILKNTDRAPSLLRGDGISLFDIVSMVSIAGFFVVALVVARSKRK